MNMCVVWSGTYDIRCRLQFPSQCLQFCGDIWAGVTVMLSFTFDSVSVSVSVFAFAPSNGSTSALLRSAVSQCLVSSCRQQINCFECSQEPLGK